MNHTFCDRCGILTSGGQYCTTEDRVPAKDGLPGCVEAMTPDKDGKVACWCTSFLPRRFKHQNKLSKAEMGGIQKHCPGCQGTGRCDPED